ncbi:hypothetical protein [Spirosoma pollinicola]|uniref:Uncharacterized protein n=1 Tax=Spirosoma pollinicola TaxID=2057025 RepID=A0A2K8Z1V5_9BACT|nr:hypothetical protein [Spirosoma pollinicola]AUD03872.1 hypothetical protein CWM47_19820 [Spirosoma pollinicola]
MIIELYASPKIQNQSEHPESPISNTKGELPDEEPALEFGDLIGSFDSREEAIAFVQTQANERKQQVIDTQSGPYNAYTHVEWLTLTVSKEGSQTGSVNYYLVSDEGY